MENPKILVAFPTYKGMKYCHTEFFSTIKNFSYKNCDILAVENSEDDLYFNKLKKEEILLIKNNFEEKDKMKKLVDSRNKILKFAREKNYDYVLMLDSDVIPPKNAVEELLQYNKEIISGIYYNYFVVSGETKWLPVCWKYLTESEFKNLQKTIQFPDFVKTREDLKRHLTEQEVQSNEVHEVAIASGGCLLLSKKAFSQLSYGILDTKEFNNMKTTDDIFLFLQAKELGFKIYCNTKVKCEHLLKGKFKEENGFYKHPIYEK